MSLLEIQNAVLLFSNPNWSGGKTVPASLTRNLTEYVSQIAYEERITSNLTTLTTTNLQTAKGIINGLLYVPDISTSGSCSAQQYDYVPRNVTHRQQLPPTNYKLIAIAPWFSIDCTQQYLSAVRQDDVRAFIFYKPNNSTNKPQDVDSPVWDLDDGGAWKQNNRFPIFAVPGLEGQNMITQLSYYSGSIAQAPHGQEINELYGPNANDYVRIVSSLKVHSPRGTSALWTYFLIVIGVLVFIVASISVTMHLIQSRRRRSLKRRVESGEVDLEAMGIKRLTVPASHIKYFPLYTYTSEPDMLSVPPTPGSIGSTLPPSAQSSRKTRRHDQRNGPSDIMSQRSTQSRRSMRSKRSNLTGAVDTTATNFQPSCHICLIGFDDRLSIIRELPCGHIFHPKCIDEFLLQNSSLCPMCKQCMLPRGYSPKITNGMVRRERAVRRLRQRIDIDDSSLESGDTKLKEWSKRLFASSTSTTVQPDVPLAAVKPLRATREPLERAIDSVPEEPSSAPSTSAGVDSTTELNATSKAQNTTVESKPPRATKKARPRKQRPRALRLLPTQPENAELVTAPDIGRGSPSSFARERMRDIAAHNAPFEDPDHHPKWRLAVSKVFPGLL